MDTHTDLDPDRSRSLQTDGRGLQCGGRGQHRLGACHRGRGRNYRWRHARFHDTARHRHPTAWGDGHVAASTTVYRHRGTPTTRHKHSGTSSTAHRHGATFTAPHSYASATNSYEYASTHGGPLHR
jgi:hypothetical protein